MRNRIIGGLALFFGLAFLGTLFLGSDDFDFSMLFVAVLFIVVGAWQLFTGKGMASLGDFLKSGKIENDK